MRMEWAGSLFFAPQKRAESNFRQAENYYFLSCYQEIDWTGAFSISCISCRSAILPYPVLVYSIEKIDLVHLIYL
jgi:hypothetical protein